jgi:hypothetical protein
MAKAKKAKSAASAPRKRATHERALKNRPVDPSEPVETAVTEQEPQEASDTEEEQPLPGTPGAKKRGRQPRLPQMEDPEIEELEAAAEEYASIRDQRIALTPQEHQLKETLLGLMKKHKKTNYLHDGYDIKIVSEKETVRVKIKKED